MKVVRTIVSVILIMAFLAACSPAATTQAPTAKPADTAVPAAKTGKICIALDSGGVDDKGYNQGAWEGGQAAAKELNWDAVYLTAAQTTDWEKNINEFLNSKCSLIVAVGFVGADALKAAATANPKQPFQIVDNAFDPVIPNVASQLYAMEEGSFLAGYLAAGMSKSGKIGGFGGINIPPVADFFIGFADGIAYYNKVHGTSAKLVSWSNEKLDGTFVGSFTDTEAAKRNTENLMDEGVDIILPQSGPEALAAAAAIKARGGGVLAVGADADQFLADKASGSVYLTTIMKNLGVAVIECARSVAKGTFKGGTSVATLATGGLGLAPFHDYDSKVPAALKTELDGVKADIISGKIKVPNWASLSAKK